MHKKINILIADDNIEFTNLLSQFLEKDEDFNLVGIAHDGIETLEKLEKLKPDLLVLDVIMPYLDGIGVLENMNSMQLLKKPKIVMLSAVGHDTITHRAMSLGADYYLLKPFKYDMFTRRVKEIIYGDTDKVELKEIFLKNNIEETVNLEFEISDMLQKIGVPANIKGYMYLGEAIEMVIKDRTLLGSITKRLYPDIAKVYDTKDSRVERSIRHAVDVAWNKGNKDFRDGIFGINSTKPTNSEFVAIISDKIRIEKEL